ncbi:UNVERIFIED_CONTAM: hypothetical protein HDU68_001052 [Siphonaria sp. JEL0065]|nr:hypothetical protein HDU68_001052 [Siphonaria sp. JEL0065]
MDAAHIESLKQAAIHEAHSNEMDFLRLRGTTAKFKFHNDIAMITMTGQGYFESTVNAPTMEVREACASMPQHGWTMKVFRSAQTAEFIPTIKPNIFAASTASTTIIALSSPIGESPNTSSASEASATAFTPTISSINSTNRTIQGGKFIRLYHKERNGYLSCPPFLTLAESTFDAGGVDEQKVQLMEYHFDPLNPQDGSSCLSMWQVEIATDMFGGEAVEWGTIVRLRHTASNMYLSVKREHDFSVDDGETISLLVDLAPAPGASNIDRHSMGEGWMNGDGGFDTMDPTVFVFVQVNAETQACISSGNYMRIQHYATGTWLHPVYMGKGSHENRKGGDSFTTNAFSGNPGFSFACKGNSYFMVASYENHMDDYFSISLAEPELVDKFNYVHSYVPWILQFVAQSRKSAESKQQLYPIKTKEDKTLRMILSSLIYFCTKSHTIDPMKREGTPILLHQTLLRETSIIEILIKFLKYPFCPEDRFSLQTALYELEIGCSSDDLLESRSASRESPKGSENIQVTVSIPNADGETSSAPLYPEGASGLQRERSSSPGRGRLRRSSKFDVGSSGSLSRDQAIVRLGDIKNGTQECLIRIFRYIYRVLKQYLLGSEHNNQSHMADKFMILSEHIDLNVGAADTLMQLIDGNPSIVQKISTEQIESFISLLARDRNPSYVNFLIAMCYCDGVAMPAHQYSIAQKLLGSSFGEGVNGEILPQSEELLPVHLFRSRISDGGFLEVYPATEKVFRRWLPLHELCQKASTPAAQKPISSLQAAHTRRRTMSSSRGVAGSGNDVRGAVEAKKGIPNRIAIAAYFEVTLKLYKALCLGQNSKVIDLLTNKWRIVSLKECYIGMCDENLPDSIRGLYGDLIRVVFVDKFPITPVRSNYIFPIESISKRPSFEEILKDSYTQTDVDEKGILSLSAQFTEKFLSSQTSQIAGNANTNHFVLSMLRLIKCLAQFGYIREENRIKELFRVLMLVLDGKTDLRDEEMAALNDEDRSRTPWALKDRFEFNELNQPIIQSKIEICLIMEQLTQLRLEMRSYLFLADGKRSMDRNTSGKSDISFGFRNVQTLLATIMDETAYFRLRDILSPILLELLRYESPKLKQCAVRLLHRMFSSIEELLDINKTAVVLNDPEHIQSYQWIRNKIRVFTENGVGTSAVSETSSEVILGGITFDTAFKMKQLLTDLGNLCVLGSKTTGCTEADKVIKAPENVNGIEPDTITQIEIRNLGIHNWIIQMLKNRLSHAVAESLQKAEASKTIGGSAGGTLPRNSSAASSSIDSRFSSDEPIGSSVDSLLMPGVSCEFSTDSLSSPIKKVQSEILLAAFEFLYRFSNGNKQHMAILFDHFDLLIESTNPRLSGASPDISFGCVQVLGQILSQSVETCLRISEHHIAQILELSHGRRSEYIRLLKYIIRVEGRVLKRNQALIMKLLLENRKLYINLTVLLDRFKSDLDEDVKEERRAVEDSESMKKSPSGHRLSLSVALGARMSPTLGSSLDIKPFNTNDLRRISTPLSPSVTRAAGRSHYAPLRLKNGLASLLVTSYIQATGEEDNEKHPERIQKDRRSWKFLEFVSSFVKNSKNTLKQKKSLDKDEDSFLFGGALKFVESFYKYCIAATANDTSDAFDISSGLVDDLTELAGFVETHKLKVDAVILAIRAIISIGFEGSKCSGAEYESWRVGSVENHQKLRRGSVAYSHTTEYMEGQNVVAVNRTLFTVLERITGDPAIKAMNAKEFNMLAHKFNLVVEKRMTQSEFVAMCAPTKSIIEYLEQSSGVVVQSTPSVKRRYKRKTGKGSFSVEDVKYDIKTLKILEWLVTEEIAAVERIDRNKNPDKWLKAETQKVEVQRLLNQLGCTLMAERLLTSERSGVFSASLRVLIVLLDGGNKCIQNSLESYWLGTREERFFYCIHETIKKFVVQVRETRMQQEAKIANEQRSSTSLSPEDSTNSLEKSQSQLSVNIEDQQFGSTASLSHIRAMNDNDSPSVAGSGGIEDGEYSAIRSVMRLLQLLVEGHNFRIQEYMRTQPDNIKTFNLIRQVVDFLHAIVSIESAQIVPVLIQVFDTLIDLSQGCTQNQEYNGCSADQILELKGKAALSLLSLLEDDTDDDTLEVFKQMAVMFDLRSLLENLDGVYKLVTEEEVEKRTKTREQFKNMARKEVIFALMKHVYGEAKKISAQFLHEALDSWNIGLKILVPTDAIELTASAKPDSIPTIRDSNVLSSFGPKDKSSKESLENLRTLPGIEDEEDSEKQSLLPKAEQDAIPGPVIDAQHRHISFSKMQDDETNGDAIDDMKEREGDGEDGEVNKANDCSPRDTGFIYSMLIATLLPYMSLDNQDLCERSVAFNSFNNKTGRIEIVRELNNAAEKRLYTVLFPIPDICFYIKDYTKDRFLWMRKSHWWRGAYMLSFMINIGNMMCMIAPTGDAAHDDFSKCPALVDHGRTFLGLIQILFWIFSSAEFMVTQLPLLVNRKRIQRLIDENAKIRKENEHRLWSGGEKLDLKSVSELQSLGLTPKDLIRGFFNEPKALYHATMVFLAVLGLEFPSLYAIHLLDFMYRDEVLQGVIASVTLNWSSLSKTVILGVIIIYIYSVIGFVWFRHAFSESEGLHCNSLFSCFLTVLSYGLRSGGGIGELLQVPVDDTKEYYGARILLDLSFFLIVIVFLLNVVFGIIFDTFGQLREERKDISDDLRTQCYVCSINASEFQRHSNGFENHIKKEHNIWHYLFFLVHLELKDKTEYTSHETFISESLAKNDLSFFPINRAIALKNWEESDNVVDKISVLETSLRSVMDNVNSVRMQMQQQLEFSAREAQIANTKASVQATGERRASKLQSAMGAALAATRFKGKRATSPSQ